GRGPGAGAGPAGRGPPGIAAVPGVDDRSAPQHSHGHAAGGLRGADGLRGDHAPARGAGHGGLNRVDGRPPGAGRGAAAPRPGPGASARSSASSILPRMTSLGSGTPTTSWSLPSYSNWERKKRMALSRARFLSLERMIVHGAYFLSVRRNISSLACVYASHRSSDSRSIGESFQRRTGSS